MIWNRWRGFDKTWTNPAESRAWKLLCPSLADVAHWQVGPGQPHGRRRGAARGRGLRGGEHLRRARARARRSAAPSPRRRTASAARRSRSSGTPSGRDGSPATRPSSGERSRSTACPHEVVGVMPPGFALPTDFGEDAAEPDAALRAASARARRVPCRVREPRGPHGGAAAAGRHRGSRHDELSAAMEQLTAEGRYDPGEGHDAFAVPLADEILGPSTGRSWRWSPRPRSSSC